MITPDTVLIVAWVASALLLGLNAWEICSRPRRHPDDAMDKLAPIWREVGFYLTPHYAAVNSYKVAPLYYNPEPGTPRRWAYPDLTGRLIYPSENGVRRRGINYAGTPLIK